ncbi:unnamed protein product [Mytilus edulis]|uniref:LRAT domain-containing protein n=1 Tax=Mytilus edulis TaxID=6550 RepID=A0A8S3S0Y7_MYTED|nr:unnamed protein product [Mytilus edulis]
MSDLEAKSCQKTIDNPIDLIEENTHLVKHWNSEKHVDDSVDQSHDTIFFYNINEKSSTENQQGATRESIDVAKIETKSNDNEVRQKTITYTKSLMDINTKAEKSPDEFHVVNPSSKSSKLDDSPIMQRPPSHITIYKLTQTNTPSKEVKQLDLDKITEEVDTLTRQNSLKKLNDVGFDDISENGIEIGNSTFYIDIKSIFESIQKKDESDYLLETNNDDRVYYDKDRFSCSSSDDDTDSNVLHSSFQSMKHDESEAGRSCMDCIKPVQVKNWTEINQGDHIILSRSFYDHHAIVVRVFPSKDDNSDQVGLELIHHTNSAMGALRDSMRRKGKLAKLKRATETVNLKTDIVSICKYWGSIKPRSPEEVVKRAIGAYLARGTKEEFAYDVFDNNCEHFVSWCVTGKKLSIQIRKAVVVFKICFQLQKGLSGLSDELLRNQVEYKHGMLCKMCFERNEKMLSVTKKKVWLKDDLQKGDIILYRYFKLQHCSVVLDIIKRKEKHIKCEIAHYAFNGLFKEKKIQSDILKVPFNGTVSVFDYASDFTTYEPEEVVCRARERIGEKMFSYFSNDSSHFARWCKLKLLN